MCQYVNVSYTNENIHKDEAEERSESQNSVVGLVVSEPGHRALKPKESRVEHLTTLEIDNEAENREPSFCFWEEVKPFDISLILGVNLLLVAENKNDVGRD